MIKLAMMSFCRNDVPLDLRDDDVDDGAVGIKVLMLDLRIGRFRRCVLPDGRADAACALRISSCSSTNLLSPCWPPTAKSRRAGFDGRSNVSGSSVNSLSLVMNPLLLSVIPRSASPSPSLPKSWTSA